MADAADGFVAAQVGGDVEDMGAEFGADKHDAQGHQQFAGFDRGGGGHFFEAGLQRWAVPALFELELADEFDEKELFVGRPFGPDGVEVDGGGGLEEEAGLGDEVGQEGAAFLDEVEDFFEGGEDGRLGDGYAGARFATDDGDSEALK